MPFSAPRSLRVLFIPSYPRRFLSALSAFGILGSKLIHLKEHLLIEPFSIEFLFFFPTFFVFDLFIFFSILYALYRPPVRDIIFNSSNNVDKSEYEQTLYTKVSESRPCKVLGSIFNVALILYGVIMPFVIYFASSSEVSFYWQSGQIIMWSMTGRVIKDPQSFTGMAGEGTTAFIVVLVLIFALARIERTVTDNVLAYACKCCRKREQTHQPLNDVENSYYTTDDDDDSDAEGDEKTTSFQLEGKTFNSARQGTLRKWVLFGGVFTTAILVLSMFRPLHKYDDVVTTVPLIMLDAFEDPSNHAGGGNEDFCGSGADQVGNGLLDFPYPKLTLYGKQEKNPDYEWFSKWIKDQKAKGFDRHKPDVQEQWKKWGKLVLDRKVKGLPVPKRLPGGIESGTPPKGYHQAFDPLRISNLHLDVHPGLRAQTPEPTENGNYTTKSLKDVKIRNVVLVTMESTRQHVFPVRNNTRFADDIYSAREAGKEYADPLSLTPFARKLYGKEPGKGGGGGVMYTGALTGSEFTLKSLLLSHCGLNPLAVDFMEEMEGKAYQACLPQIFKLLNENKKKNEPGKGNNETDWKDSRWMTHYLQSVTTGFDRQTTELGRMGFDTNTEMVSKETIEKPGAKFSVPAGEKTLNYFGYREAVIMPYIQDLINQTKASNSRLFLSHLTSSTHHPWAVPENFWKKGQFLEDKERNNYLNAVGFVDHWLDEFMQELENQGIANETLVVFLGDHGLSIGEGGSADSGRVSTFANPHVNNFRIPIAFHHPELPPVHITANATNLSILPTILDLLLSSDSLSDNTEDKRIISALRGSYEGQSLIRPMVHKTRLGLENYNFGVLNPGGTHLVITSSDPQVPYRTVMPLCQKAPYAVANLREDEDEEHALRLWTTNELYPSVEKKWGKEAREWTEKGIELGRWWVREGRRRWDYSKAARNDERKKDS